MDVYSFFHNKTKNYSQSPFSKFSFFAFQPEVSTYCSELMPLLLGYLSSLNQAKIGHVTKAFYALENFMENLGKREKISPETNTVKLTQLPCKGRNDPNFLQTKNYC